MEDAVKKYSHKIGEYKKILEERKKEQDLKKKEASFFGKIETFFKGEEKHESAKILNVKKENSVTFNHASGKF